MRVGVLALQGDYAAHQEVLSRLGVPSFAVRTRHELAGADGVVLPGGESTTMLELLEREEMTGLLKERIGAGLPVFATCAGTILLARTVVPAQPGLGILDLTAQRNAYGRQVHSAVVEVRLDDEFGEPPVMEGVFIRAPRLADVGESARVLAWRDDDPVLVEQGTVLAATFHPELGHDDRIAKRFVAHMGGSNER